MKKTVFAIFCLLTVCLLGLQNKQNEKKIKVGKQTIVFKKIPNGKYHYLDSNYKIKEFYILESEVTQELFEFVAEFNNSKHLNCNACPIETVSWLQAQAFIVKLNEKTKMKFRLPTTVEWLYAANGNSKFIYSGSDNYEEVGWFKQNCGDSTHPVKLLKPNQFGLYDMSGNVMEWAYDWGTSPNSKMENAPKSLLGCSYDFPANDMDYCTMSNSISSKSDRYGFRIILDL